MFALFGSTAERDTFFEKLNKAHPNLQFTMEVSTTSLPFLDTSIAIKDGNFDVTVYRKPTNTGVVLNFKATAPRKWKRSLIKCFLTRAMKICSSWESFNSEVDVIKDLLNKNCYPSTLIEKNITEFIDRHNLNEQSFPPAIEKMPEKANNKPEDYLLIPYWGKPSLKFQKCLQKELNKYDANFKVAYSTTKVGSYFSLKTFVPALFRANVVYKFTGSCDKNISYI